MGYSQAVRQRTLTPSLPGSNPGSPAIYAVVVERQTRYLEGVVPIGCGGSNPLGRTNT